ncbi:hypothetical protein [Thiohalophilus sp.]|uniref:hypothetical protein n=1 Tax=Thiohalophilus sp. TaxID=3028392 RepID=UPI003974E463
MPIAKTLITTLLAAGTLLLANPAGAADYARSQSHAYQASHYPTGQLQRVHGKSHRKHHRKHSGIHNGRDKRNYLGHDRSPHQSRYHQHRHYRPDVIVIPRERHRHDHYRYRYRSHRSSGLSTITGGVIGGLVGNHIGHGDPLATGIGIMTGAVIGDHLRH